MEMEDTDLKHPLGLNLSGSDLAVRIPHRPTDHEPAVLGACWDRSLLMASGIDDGAAQVMEVTSGQCRMHRNTHAY